MESGLRMEFVPVGACRFYRNARGFLGLELDGRDYRRVSLRRALPFTAPERYICVADMEDKEIAVIESIEAFDESQQALLREELGIRYFYPVVTAVKSVKEKMGSYYLQISVGAHEMNIAVKDISKNIRQMEANRLIVTDVDGNRYLIPDVYAISKKNLRMLEPYLY
ncbi:MAG: DUF1854 domain-containing protein [Oscillospiraceae bacterium]|jgi:hypothetical protein|nr:DUF1854 domain-containing protein [Oscillospiraceae bacterium]